jgi:ankyrin repeat protein/TPR repeat protein
MINSILRIIRMAGVFFFCACLLVAAGCTSSIPEGFDVPAWMASVATGDTAAVKAGLDQGVPPTIRNDDGFTALQIAVRNGRHQTAKTLIEAGADVNDDGEEGLAPLFYAIYGDDAGMVRLLMDSGADFRGRDRFGKDPLTLSLARRNMKVITELALTDSGTGKKVHQWIDRQDADKVFSGLSKNEAMDLLCLKGILQLTEAEDLQSAQEAEAILHHLRGQFRYDDLDASLALIKAYSDPDSPLFDLAKAEEMVWKYYHSQDEKEVAFFAKRACGREPLAALLYGQALLVAAAEAEKSLVYDQTEPAENAKQTETRTAGVKLIVESAEAGNPFAQAYVGEFYQGLFPKATEKEIRRETIAWLKRAADSGHAKSAYNLARLYSDGEFIPGNPKKALYWFKRAGEHGNHYAYYHIAHNFQHGDEGFPLDQGRAFEWYEKAARCGNGHASKTLAEAYEKGKLGLAVDELQACKYYLALPEKEENNHDEKIGALASRGLIEDVQNRKTERVEEWLKMLPSDYPARLDGWLAAAANNAPELAEEFLRAGMDVNVRHKDRTALMVAAVNGHDKTITRLLQQGADVSLEDSFGETALSLAAGQGHLEIVRLLLNHGAAPQAGAGSPSPLAQAVRGGHFEVARLLLDEGAKMPSIESSIGRSLLAFCRQRNNSRMEALVLEAQSDDVSAAARNDAVSRLDRRDETARRTQQWLAGKLIVRLDERGQALSAQDDTWDAAPWRCVDDQMSGLIWLVKDDANGLHDKDMIFTIPREKSAGCSVEDCDVFAYRDLVRAEQVCGATDWRVPTVEELESLAYPHMADSFPHWPGFVQWARREAGGDLVLAHASGLFGRTTGVIAFNLAGQALLVHGKLQPLPVEPRTDFTLIGFE